MCYHYSESVSIATQKRLEEAMIRTQIQLEEAQYRSLKELAARQGVSIAELVRRAVDNLLETSGVISREERFRRSLTLIGQFRSGKTDISERHDEYLAEAYGEWLSS
jgi:hypothetical protein